MTGQTPSPAAEGAWSGTAGWASTGWRLLLPVATLLTAEKNLPPVVAAAGDASWPWHQRRPAAPTCTAPSGTLSPSPPSPYIGVFARRTASPYITERAVNGEWDCEFFFPEAV
jgi:hypothetical protein